VRAYYDRRAPEYDEWYLGSGRFAERDRPGWDEELEAFRRTLEALPPARTLDVACGTGFLTRHLPGEIVGLDQSESMLEEARRQAPNATYLSGDALSLPFEDGSFERVFSGHFYGHLEEPEREAFLRGANVAVLSTVDSRGRPHAAPVWYLYDDGVFRISTGEGSQKHRNIVANPNISLVIDQRELPYYAVMVQGTAEIGPGFSDDDRLRLAVRRA